MNIETGLFDHGVLQRGAGNVSHARVTGTCGDRGPVTLTVLRKGAPLRGFSKVRAGTAGGGRFRAVLAGIPAAGPTRSLSPWGTGRSWRGMSWWGTCGSSGGSPTCRALVC